MDEIDLVEYLRILTRRARFIAVLAVGLSLVTFVVLKLFPETYRGQALLIFPQVEAPGAGVLSRLGLTDIANLGVPMLSGQGMYSDILQSRILSEQVVREMGLSAVEVEPEDMQEAIDLTATKAGALRISCYASSAWVRSGRLAWLDSDPRLPKNASVRRKTAFLAKEIANTYIRRLQDFDRRHSLSTGRRHRVFLEGEVEKTRQQLAGAEDALRRFKEAHPLVPPVEAATQQVQQVVDLRKNQIETGSELSEVERSARDAQRIVAKQQELLTAARVIQENPVVTALKGQLAQAEVRRARLLENMTESHPDVVAVTQEIEKTGEKIRKEVARITSSETVEVNPVRQALVQNLAMLEIKRSGLRARLDALNGAMSRVEQEMSKMARDQMRYIRLYRDVRALEAVYTSLLTEYSKAKVEEAKEPEGFTVVDWAVPERRRFSPKMKLTAAVVFLLGAILGSLIAIAQEGGRRKPAGKAPSETVPERR